MQIPFVDLKAQYESIKAEIDSAIAEVISQSAYIGGSFVKAFENDFADFCNVKHCIGVGNGTDALYISLKALGVDRGDEVITAANSFIATSEAITQTGAKVVFVDIDPRTYNIDTAKIEEKITPKTKAIIPVHIYGQPAEMKPILSLAKKYSIKIIEDSAQAHGALYEGQPSGSFGEAGCFSFYPGKNLGAYGDGGAVVTNSDELAKKIRMIANHGRVSKYDHEFEGVNSRLDGLQARILNVKLKHLPIWNERRRENATLYAKYLKGTKVIIPEVMNKVTAVHHLYVIRVEPKIRSEFMKYLNENGISTGIHYPIALPFLKAYRYLSYNKSDFPEAGRASQEIVSLPIYPELTESEIAYIAEKVEHCGLF